MASGARKSDVRGDAERNNNVISEGKVRTEGILSSKGTGAEGRVDDVSVEEPAWACIVPAWACVEKG